MSGTVLGACHRAPDDPHKGATLMSARSGGGVALDRRETGIDGGAFAGLGKGGEPDSPGQQLMPVGEGWSHTTHDRGKA